jgi:hypothetical protein
MVETHTASKFRTIPPTWNKGIMLTGELIRQ